MATSTAPTPRFDPSRLKKLQILGVMCGLAAGAWLGAAEAPTKLVKAGISPVVISLVMVIGVFLARWSVPALARGTAQIGIDARQAPHLILWAILAGCLWAVANAGAAVVLLVIMAAILGVCGAVLWKTTRFN